MSHKDGTDKSINGNKKSHPKQYKNKFVLWNGSNGNIVGEIQTN